MSAADDAAIRNQLARLVRMLDAKQLDDLGAVIAEDVVFDYGDGAGEQSGLATMASGPLFDRYGAQGYLLMSVMCVIGVVGALRLYGLRRLDPA